MHRTGKTRRGRTAAAAAALAAVTALTLAGCSTPSSAAPAASVAVAAGATDLASVCPANIVVQTSWYPQAETGYLFQLIKDDYTVDAGKKSVSGPLKAAGGTTGVTLEIRAGGPAIGFQQPASQMYTDPSISMAVVSSDQALQQSAKFATLTVFAALDKAPLIVLWDPATYPDVKTIKELGPEMKKKGGVLLYSQGQSYVDYLISSGQLTKSEVDGSYDGTPATFIAAGGKDSTQAYSTNEAYTYPNLIKQWKKPVAYQLLADAGWDTYPNDLAIRAGDKGKLAPCLKELVPIFQQANVDFFKDPSGASKVILDQVKAFDSGDTYDQGTIDAAVKTMVDEKLVGNGSDAATGGFDMDRLQAFFKTATPIFESEGSTPAKDATPQTLFTNEFIDPTIGF